MREVGGKRAEVRLVVDAPGDVLVGAVALFDDGRAGLAVRGGDEEVHGVAAEQLFALGGDLGHQLRRHFAKGRGGESCLKRSRLARISASMSAMWDSRP